MANPGYPMGGQMPPMGGPPMGGPPGGPPMGGPPMGGPPMGGPPMGGPPMGGPPMGMQRPMRRGTPKIVPIIMSAGLAVGVFCGLLFGVGKKSEAVAAAPSTGSDATQEAQPTAEAKAEPAAPTAAGATTPTATAGATTPEPTPTVPTTPTPAQGSAEGSATVAAAVEAKKIKLTVTIKPDAAAKDAKLWIDGAAVDGMIAEVPADTKSVKVEVKASGYRSVDKKIDLVGGDTSVEFEMAKRPASGGPAPVRPPKRPDRPPSNSSGGGGGLIDI